MLRVENQISFEDVYLNNYLYVHYRLEIKETCIQKYIELVKFFNAY